MAFSICKAAGLNVHFVFLLEISFNIWQYPFISIAMKEQFSIKFKTAFLNEQLQIGNLEQLAGFPAVRIKASFDFKGVDYDERHVHRNKISSSLRKEGYVYSPQFGFYVKSNI
jgi:hypothetical protein